MVGGYPQGTSVGVGCDPERVVGVSSPPSHHPAVHLFYSPFPDAYVVLVDSRSYSGRLDRPRSVTSLWRVRGSGLCLHVSR